MHKFNFKKMTELKRTYKPALVFMVLHALLVIIWNIAGVWLLSHNKSALGPTATFTAALVFAILIAIYFWFYKKGWEKLFLTVVTIGALLGSIAIYGAFTKDPALWPSEFWRYAGVAVNGLGILGLLFSLKVLFIKKH